MVQVNINEKNWDEFIIQSRRLGTNASQRISKFIEKELKKSFSKGD